MPFQMTNFQTLFTLCFIASLGAAGCSTPANPMPSSLKPERLKALNGSNTQKYVPNIFKANAEDFVKARHKVFHSKQQPSTIKVQVFK